MNKNHVIVVLIVVVTVFAVFQIGFVRRLVTTPYFGSISA